MSLKKGTIYVLVANIFNLIVSLFSGFVLPKFLAIETYSEIKLFQLYITYIGILHLGYADGVYLQYGGKDINKIDKKEVCNEFKSFKLFQFIISIICIIISIYLKNYLLLFCSLVILPINVGNYFRNLYSAIGEFKKYSRFTNISTILIFIINLLLLFIIKSNNSIEYIVGYVIVYFIYWIIIEIENTKLFGKHKYEIDKMHFIRNIKNGFFLMIGNFCNVIFTSIDRLFVKNLLGSIKFAFYSFAVSVENLMSVFITPISTTMYNYFCKHTSIDNILILKRLVLLFSALIISLIFPAKFIIDEWLINYKPSLKILFLLFSAQYISIIIRCIHVNLYKSQKKQNRYFIIMLLIVTLSVILNIVFYIFNRDMEGIALATLITNIVWFIIGEIDLKKFKFNKLEYIYVFIILFIFLLCSNINNAIIGFLVYISLVLIISMIVLKTTIEYCILEMYKLKKVLITKFKGKKA